MKNIAIMPLARAARLEKWKVLRCSGAPARQPRLGRTAGEILEVVDQVRLVEIAVLQSHLCPVRLFRQAFQSLAGGPETADTGKQFRADADVLAKLQRQVLARHAQLRGQSVHAHQAGCAFDGRDGVVGRTGLTPWRRGAQAQQQIILQNRNSLRIRQGLAPQRVTEACRQRAAPQLPQSRAAIAQFAQG